MLYLEADTGSSSHVSTWRHPACSVGVVVQNGVHLGLGVEVVPLEVDLVKEVGLVVGVGVGLVYELVASFCA